MNVEKDEIGIFSKKKVLSNFIFPFDPVTLAIVGASGANAIANNISGQQLSEAEKQRLIEIQIEAKKRKERQQITAILIVSFSAIIIISGVYFIKNQKKGG